MEKRYQSALGAETCRLVDQLVAEGRKPLQLGSDVFDLVAEVVKSRSSSFDKTRYRTPAVDSSQQFDPRPYRTQKGDLRLLFDDSLAVFERKPEVLYIWSCGFVD